MKLEIFKGTTTAEGIKNGTEPIKANSVNLYNIDKDDAEILYQAFQEFMCMYNQDMEMYETWAHLNDKIERMEKTFDAIFDAFKDEWTTDPNSEYTPTLTTDDMNGGQWYE